MTVNYDYFLLNYIAQMIDVVVDTILSSAISRWQSGRLDVLDKFTIRWSCQIDHHIYPRHLTSLIVTWLVLTTTLRQLLCWWFAIAFFNFGESNRKSLPHWLVQYYLWQHLEKVKVKVLKYYKIYFIENNAKCTATTTIIITEIHSI